MVTATTTRRIGHADSFQQICGALNVGGECQQWFTIARAHQRLGGQMQNDLRRRQFDLSREFVGIPNVDEAVIDQPVDPDKVGQAWRGGGRQADANYPGLVIG